MSEEEERAYVEDTGEIEEQLEEVETEDMTVSLNAMSGNLDGNTLRFKGKVNGKDVFILIGSGSTHCFVDEQVIHTLGYKLEYTIPMMVSVADGSKLISRTHCPDFCWEIQGHQFTRPVRVIKLGGCDVVLGGDWLRENNPVEFDYHKIKVTISRRGKKVIMKALTGQAELQVISAKAMSKLFRRSAYGLCGHLFAVSATVIDEGEKGQQLTELFHQYEDIF